ncbi:hypothetical protein [uncultured Arthrobacter sp.]|uniref:hypothetical protein n=1 Tax=uncultured Arthrobacter sp. TaxID=114050 RepID=UPI00260ACF90|nr:hypothetical protein [uncultured Arthrobacter sp.]
MSEQEKSRPTDQAADKFSLAGDGSSSLPAGTLNLREFDAYDAGYTAGYLAGYAAAELTQEQQAENAARRFYALEGAELHARKVAQGAAAMIEVNAYRRSPESSYIPRKGDPRYTAVKA